MAGLPGGRAIWWRVFSGRPRGQGGYRWPPAATSCNRRLPSRLPVRPTSADSQPLPMAGAAGMLRGTAPTPILILTGNPPSPLTATLRARGGGLLVTGGDKALEQGEILRQPPGKIAAGPD